MKVVIQRVKEAKVDIGGETTAVMGPGLLVFLGIEQDDVDADAGYIARKLCALRIFPDEEGKMNRDIREAGGDLMVVSQFTLHAATRKGNRPSFIRAARPEVAIPLYEKVVLQAQHILGKNVLTGRFGADMSIHLVNDGPVTIIMDSKSEV